MYSLNKRHAHIVRLFFVSLSMKRLWLILLFLNPCFSQFSEKSFKLVKGENIFTIIPDKKIVINKKEYIYKKIDYKNEQIMVKAYNSEKEKFKNIKFNFNEIKSISFMQSKFYRASQGCLGGALVGFFIALYLNEQDDDKKKKVSLDSFSDELGESFRLVSSTVFGGLAGMIIALSTNYSDYDLKIGHNDWQIK